ncbi:MAG: FAD-binding oxidoreductase [Chloroflexi bacterium]|nr:FAD-binding oxidoreductase [Chloroflexota bacterium]
MQHWDVIIVGGGMVGLASSYHLAKKGAKTLLLQAGDFGGGTSAANAGRAQVSEGYLDPVNIQAVREGVARMDNLAGELDSDFEWQRSGYLCLIKTQPLWDEWTRRSQILSHNGIPTEVIDVDTLTRLEPFLNTEGLIGAAYTREGLLNPFKFCWAYRQAASRQGATLLAHSPVTGLEVQDGRITAVETRTQRYAASVVAVMCGAWTPQVTRLAGVDVPIRHTHAEAMILEPLPPWLLRNTIGLADFYELIHGRQQAVAIGLGPHPNGGILVTEAVAQTDELHQRNSVWGITGIARELVKLYPTLGKARVLRAWGSPTPFTPDGNPLIGWAPGLENLFLAASFMQTISVVPVVSEWIADMILGKALSIDLGLFSPARFVPFRP